MDNNEKKKLNPEELDKVSGGEEEEIPLTTPDGSPIKCCYCGSADWTNHGWSEEFPRGYRVECNKCHKWDVYDGFNW